MPLDNPLEQGGSSQMPTGGEIIKVPLPLKPKQPGLRLFAFVLALLILAAGGYLVYFYHHQPKAKNIQTLVKINKPNNSGVPLNIAMQLIIGSDNKIAQNQAVPQKDGSVRTLLTLKNNKPVADNLKNYENYFTQNGWQYSTSTVAVSASSTATTEILNAGLTDSFVKTATVSISKSGTDETTFVSIDYLVKPK